LSGDHPSASWYKKTPSHAYYIYANGEVYGDRRSKFSVDDQTSGVFQLSVINVTNDDAGTYVCADDLGRGDESKGNAELNVLKGDPLVELLTKAQVISASFEYRGKATLAGRWIVTFRNGTIQIASSIDELTASGYDKKVDIRFGSVAFGTAV
jgi:hypothetical protein